MKFRKPYRIKKRRSILKNRFFWLAISILVIVGILLYFLIFSSFFQIKEIKISGNQEIPSEVLQEVIKENVEQKVLFFPTKSIFLVNLNQIKEDILNNFPKIAKIEIGRGFPDILKATLNERSAVAVFCQNDTCFLLDSEGVIFEESEPRIELVKIIDGEREKTPKLGEKIIEKDYLEKILKIQRYLSEELKLETKEFIVFSQRLNIKTVEDWEIYFDPKEDLNWQLTKLNLVLKEKIPPEKRRDLEYIELRFGDLATFRYKR